MSEPLYWCLLDEQPHYLVPPASMRAQCLEPLVINPHCRFSWKPDLDPDADEQPTNQTAPQLGEVTSFLPAQCIAWVQDPTTGADWPYWIGHAFIDAVVALSAGRIEPAALPPATRWVLAQAGILIQPMAHQLRRSECAQRAAWSKQQFRRGFAAMPALIPPFQLGAMRRYYRQCVRAGVMRLGDGQVDRRFVAYNESVARFVQQQLTGAVTQVAGRAVKPSYAYVAAYQGGAALERHTDRPQCEYTLSVCLDFTPETSGACAWSINLDMAHHTVRVLQRPGEGLLFRGRSIAHHRDRLPANASATSVLLHYVNAEFNGPLA